MWSRSARIYRQISWENLVFNFLYWPIALINLLKLVHFLTAWKKLMSLQFLKMMILLIKRTTTQLVYFHYYLRSLNNWVINIYQIIYRVFWVLYFVVFERHTLPNMLYSSYFIKVISKRVCGHNFNGFIKSIWLYTTRSSNSQIVMLWNWQDRTVIDSWLRFLLKQRTKIVSSCTSWYDIIRGVP